MSDDEIDEEMFENIEFQEMQSGFDRRLGLDDVEIPVLPSNCRIIVPIFHLCSFFPILQYRYRLKRWYAVARNFFLLLLDFAA